MSNSPAPKTPAGPLWKLLRETSTGAQLWEHIDGFIVVSSIQNKPGKSYCLLMNNNGRRCTNQQADMIKKAFGLESATEEDVTALFPKSRAFYLPIEAST
ncbi:MAG: hypothetical protein RR584_12690 [Comamonas sp.]